MWWTLTSRSPPANSSSRSHTTLRIAAPKEPITHRQDRFRYALHRIAPRPTEIGVNIGSVGTAIPFSNFPKHKVVGLAAAIAAGMRYVYLTLYEEFANFVLTSVHENKCIVSASRYTAALSGVSPGRTSNLKNLIRPHLADLFRCRYGLRYLYAASVEEIRPWFRAVGESSNLG
jgi:hypothetical protein